MYAHLFTQEPSTPEEEKSEDTMMSWIHKQTDQYKIRDRARQHNGPEASQTEKDYTK